MKNFTFLVLISALTLVTPPAKLIAGENETAVENFENVCFPMDVSFSAVNYYYPDGTYELHTDETVKDEAYHQVRIVLEQINGLIENVDYEFAEEYIAPEFCGNPGSLIYVIIGEEPIFCEVPIYWTEGIERQTCPENFAISEDDPNLLSLIEAWLEEFTIETYYPGSTVVVANNFDAGTMLVPGIYQIQFKVTGLCGDESQEQVRCSRTLTIEEGENQGEQPIALCTDITLALDDTGVATLTPEFINGGSAGGALEIDITSFSCENLGENTVTLTVTSPEGLVATCDAIVTVTDETPPDFGKGNKSIRETITEGEVYILPDLSALFPATDNCGVTNYEQIPEPGTEYTLGTTENIILTASDASDNSTELSVKFTLRVAKAKRTKSAETGNEIAVNSEQEVALSGNTVAEATLKSNSMLENKLYSETQLRVWPNPFTDRVFFEFSPESDTHVRFEIFNITGKKMATLFNQEVQKHQIYRLEFSPKNIHENIFIYRLQTGTTVKTGKLIVKPF